MSELSTNRPSGSTEQGADVAVFFDLDGTLMPMPSLERRFWRALRSAGQIRRGNHLAWVGVMLLSLRRGRSAALQANKRYLAGVAMATSVLRETRNGAPTFFPDFFPDAADRVLWHARQGQRIVLVSGTIRPLALRAAAALRVMLCERGCDVAVHVCATQLEERGGRWSGQVVGEAMFGQEKARAVRKLAAEWNLDRSRCYAYGDSMQDRWLLASVGNAFAVNPDRKLARLADVHGWPILRWEHGGAKKASREGNYRETSSAAPFPAGDAG